MSERTSLELFEDACRAFAAAQEALRRGDMPTFRVQMLAHSMICAAHHDMILRYFTRGKAFGSKAVDGGEG